MKILSQEEDLRFAPNSIPQQMPATEGERTDPWEKIVSRDGIEYYYNWYTGMVRYDAPEGEYDATEISDPLVDRALRTNPHFSSLRRGKEVVSSSMLLYKMKYKMKINSKVCD